MLGALQPAYSHLRYDVCPMQTGNFFDIVFDGQSTITARAETPPERPRASIGVDDYVSVASGESLVGCFLAVAPWVVADPAEEEPALSLGERLARLAAVGRELLPGGPRENEYRESVIWADVPVRSAANG